MALLVQTPRGTVSLPPQGFFQQQPSPFASQLTPRGLPPVRDVFLTPRIPAPEDLDSANLVQPTAIPQSTPPQRRRILRGGFDDSGFDEGPTADPPAPDPFGEFDTSFGLGLLGTVAGPPGFGVLGSGLGNVIDYNSLPPAMQEQIDPFSALVNAVTPFGLLGQSVEEQARENARNMELEVVEDALGIDVGSSFGPTSGVDDPIAEGLPEDFGFDDESDTGSPSGPGDANAANTGEEDSAEDPDSSDGDSGDGSFICTAAWDTGISNSQTWSSDKRMFAYIVKNDPDAYAGYKKIGPWIAKRVHRGKLLWMARLFPRSWAYEIDQRQGKDTSKYPLWIKIENRLQRAFVRPLFRLWGRA